VNPAEVPEGFVRDEDGSLVPPAPTAEDEADRRRRVEAAAKDEAAMASRLSRIDPSEVLKRMPADAARPRDDKGPSLTERHQAERARRRRDEEWQSDLRAEALEGVAATHRLEQAVNGSEIADWINGAHRTHPTLILAGKVGTGKTVAAVAAGARLREKDVVVRLISWPRYIDGLRVEGRRPEGVSREQFRRAYAQAQVLILDDLGRGLGLGERPTNHVVTETMELISARSTGGRTTIVTTNRKTEHLADAFGAEFTSRLGGNAKLVKYTGEDLRRPVVW